MTKLTKMIMICSVIYWCLGCATVNSATINLIDKDNPLKGWQFDNGKEFKGASGKLTVVENSITPTLKLEGDFTNGGNYVQMSKKTDALNVDMISFDIKAPVGVDMITVRIADSNNQYHQITLQLNPHGNWQQVVFPLKLFFKNKGTSASIDNVTKYLSWGGNKDGKFHNPIQSIYFLLSKKMAEKGSIELRNIQITPDFTKGEKIYITKNIPMDEILKFGEIDWHLYLGDAKGSKGNLELLKDQPESGNYGIKISADFSNSEQNRPAYVSARYFFDMPASIKFQQFNFKYRSENVNQLSFRFVDQSKQVYQLKKNVNADGKWHDYSIPIQNILKGQSWGGAKDGKWHDSIKYIGIIIGHKKNSMSSKLSCDISDASIDVKISKNLNKKFFSDNFEQNNLRKWQTTDVAEIKNDDAFEGEKYLSVFRKLSDTGKSQIISNPFDIDSENVLFSGAISCELNSPDNSFMGAVYVQWLNAGNKVIDTTELINQFGKVNWKKFSKTIRAPRSAVKAQIAVEIHKASGYLYVDDLSVRAIEDNDFAQKRIDKVIVHTDDFGNMPFPDSNRILHTDVICTKPLPDSWKQISWTVTDYWGNEIAEPGLATLQKTDRKNIKEKTFNYTTDIDISSLPIEIGKYYEVQISIPRDNSESYETFRSFAVLPKAITQEYDPSEIPFTIRSFDNRIPAYIKLAHRIGHRTAGIWGRFRKKPPYKTVLSNTKLAESLGMNIISSTEIIKIEKRQPGWDKYDWTKMTIDIMEKGTSNLLHDPTMSNMVMMCLGNEPPETEERAKEVLPYYKAIYELIKRERPEIEVIGTAVGPVEAYFKTGFGAYQDVYDFHTYEDYRKIPKIFAKYEEMFEKYGHKKPICSTELGLNSQGLPRSDVAATLIKKISIFFECGGLHVSWYGIMYPDPTGERFGGAGDTHNTFDCRFGSYSPKLDAIAYYNVLNGITNKRFIEKKTYGSLEAYLFANESNECFISMWNDKNTSMFSLPLAGVDSLELVRLDGSTETLHTLNSCVTLRVGKEPILLKFKQPEPALPTKLQPASFNVTNIPETAAKGTTVKLNIEGKNIETKDFIIKKPYGWKQSITKDENGVQLQLTVPETASGRVGKVYIQYAQKSKIYGEADVSIPLSPPLDINLALEPKSNDENPSIIITLKNNGNVKQNAYWNIKITGQLSMKEGGYNLSSPEPSEAFFTEDTEGTETLNPGQSKQVVIPISNVDPLNLYKIKAQIFDEARRATTLERYVGGFASAKKTKESPVIDGILDENCWKKATPVYLNEKRQIRNFKRIHNGGIWTGTNDLSGEIMFSWDDEYFYIAARGKDDSFNNPESGMNIWRQDGIQILVDPCRDKTVKSGKYDYSFAYGKNGPQAWCHLSASGKVSSGEVNSIKVGFDKTITQKGEFCYEIAIPWNQLDPFIPTDGADLGFALGMNEDDGNGRDSFMGWFSGISAKLLDLVGDVILQD